MVFWRDFFYPIKTVKISNGGGYLYILFSRGRFHPFLKLVSLASLVVLLLNMICSSLYLWYWDKLLHKLHVWI
jgi:hypothetical protein